MSKAVRFDRYGDLDVLHVTDVEPPNRDRDRDRPRSRSARPASTP
jgi:hypothetical protein